MQPEPESRAESQCTANVSAKVGYSALISAWIATRAAFCAGWNELKLRDNTLVIFTADHGWNAGHHGVWGRGNGTMPFNLYEESVRVPMIWNHPGRIRGRPRGDTDGFEL